MVLRRVLLKDFRRFEHIEAEFAMGLNVASSAGICGLRRK